jgi:hypothetical protein
MTKTTNPRWTNPTRLPDGHRLFEATEPYDQPGLECISASLLLGSRGMWAMADDSGRFPDDTDDGVLWLDFSRDLGAGIPATHDNPAHTPGVPLLDINGQPCSTITDTCTLLVLSVKFHWPINVLGTIMQAREI